jgi:hypothetical protein
METVNQDTNQVQEEPRTFTQEELDRIVGERLQRERAKYADFDALKEKAAKFDEAEQAQKSELQKATERAEALQKELDILKHADSVREIRNKGATETGVPASLLNADDEEGCKVQAKAILEFAKPQGYPVVKDSGEVRKTSGGATRDQFKNWLETSLAN